MARSAPRRSKSEIRRAKSAQNLCLEEEELLHQLEEEKDKHQAEKERLERTLCDLDAMIEDQVGSKQQELLEVRKATEEIQQELKELMKRPVIPVPPPGPKFLYFVDGQAFMFVAAVVIIANIVTMVIELIDAKREKLQAATCKKEGINAQFDNMCSTPADNRDFFWLDQFYMIFYIVELTLKALLWQRRLLCGKISVVWWNWLDLAIVLSGVLDMYVQPLLIATGIMGKGQSAALSSFSKLIRFARLARVLRILKIVRVFFNSDLSFVAGPHFQLFIMGVIGFNCVQMGLETDSPDFWGWPFVEHPLLIIFTFELLVRLKYEGCRFFYSSDSLAWNWLDFIIVAGGVIDMWLMPAKGMVQELMGQESKRSSNMGQVMTMLRMARLLRLLRLVRLMRSIPPLFHLVKGIMEAVQGMAWVLVLTAVLLYAFSLLAVRLVGHGLVFGGDAPPDVAEVFPSIFPSMFTLFMVMNGNFDYLQPLFDAMPGTEIIFIAFMVLASWSVLAILTAVISENMINSTEEAKAQADEEEQMRRVTDSKAELESIFKQTDQDSSGKLSKQEWLDLLRDEETKSRLLEATGMEETNLKRVFDYLSTPNDLSTDGVEYIEKKQFINGLQDDEAPVTERDVFRIEQQLSFLEFIVSKGHKDILDEMKNWQRVSDPTGAMSHWAKGSVAESGGNASKGDVKNGQVNG